MQSGFFSDSFLYTATTIKRYIPVDTWSYRSNYSDAANVDNSRQEALYQQMLSRLGPYRGRVDLQVMRMFTTDAALKVPDNSLDFIYVDARHDYCGVIEDIEAWWPKLKTGGIMAGDDYFTAAEQLHQKNSIYDPNDDWAICSDGTKHPGAVKGAVRHFATRHGFPVYSTWKHGMKESEKKFWPQWIYPPKKGATLKQ